MVLNLHKATSAKGKKNEKNSDFTVCDVYCTKAHLVTLMFLYFLYFFYYSWFTAYIEIQLSIGNLDMTRHMVKYNSIDIDSCSI